MVASVGFLPTDVAISAGKVALTAARIGLVALAAVAARSFGGVFSVALA